MVISEMIAIKSICEYEFENANYDAGHTYGIKYKLNNWYHFHFVSITISCIFYWKQIQQESLKYQLPHGQLFELHSMDHHIISSKWLQILYE